MNDRILFTEKYKDIKKQILNFLALMSFIAVETMTHLSLVVESSLPGFAYRLLLWSCDSYSQLSFGFLEENIYPDIQHSAY